MEKSVLSTYGMFGSLYARCFYSFIDLRQPKERVLSIANRLETNFVLTDLINYEKARSIFDEKYDVVCLEDILKNGEIDEEKLENARKNHLDIDPLYVNFTSGSTGEPKGVAVCHRSVVDFIEEFTDVFKFSQNDIFGNQAPFDFDVSVKDIYSSLSLGATVLIIPREYFSQPTKLMDYLSNNNVTVLVWAVSAMCFVSIMNGFEYRNPDKVRKVIFSGEVMPIKHFNKWQEYLPNAMFANVYGPTEITCNCTYYIVDRDFEDNEVMPIGIPFKNEKVFLLDENDEEVLDKDKLGEICVSGTCLALGYFNDVKRSEEAFVVNPLNKHYKEYMYRTGDLARYNDDKLLVYVGRKDNQIKHLGHRIELGEIETAVMAIDGISRSCCLYDDKNSKLIMIYTGDVDKKDVNKNLKERIPVYMMPNKMIQIDEMPMSKNGKIDRQLLKKTYM